MLRTGIVELKFTLFRCDDKIVGQLLFLIGVLRGELEFVRHGN